MRFVVLIAFLAQAFAFSSVRNMQSTTSLSAKSKAVPFLDAAPALSESLPGYAGFDPLNLSGIEADVRQFYSTIDIYSLNHPH